MAGSSTFLWKHALKLHSTLSPFDSPLPQTHQAFKGVKPVSWRRLNVAGLLITVYGMEELPQDTSDITCMWLLHGRGDTQDSMAYTAAAFLHAWNSRRRKGQRSLICVCLDQRNHGSRMVDNLSNVSWKQGNPTHGPDMFNTYSGTARDVSHLITHLPSYLPFKLGQHICGGVSLGGHATWQLLLNEPRIVAGIICVGSPDYIRLMTDRAIRSHVPTAMDSDPPGKNFLGSKDFPQPLIEAIERYDPAGVLLGELDVVTGNDHLHPPSESEKNRLRPMMSRSLGGKKILCLSGAHDKLVPYAQSEPFLTWVKKALDERNGWCNDQGIELEDVVDPNGRHEFSVLMRKKAEHWLCELLASQDRSELSHGSRL